MHEVQICSQQKRMPAKPHFQPPHAVFPALPLCQVAGQCLFVSCVVTFTVMDRVSGEVYLEGHLERGIVPEDSVWEHGGGCGEEGCLLYLHKMNLELLRKYALLLQ